MGKIIFFIQANLAKNFINRHTISTLDLKTMEQMLCNDIKHVQNFTPICSDKNSKNGQNAEIYIGLHYNVKTAERYLTQHFCK